MVVYKIIEEIGSGGYGKVYKGFEVKTGDYVAIKKINLPNPRVESEIAILKCLEPLCDRGYLCYKDVKYYKKDVWIITEYIPWINLNEMIKNTENIPSDIKKEIAVNLSEKLKFLNDSGMIHKDYNPKNVLINPNTYEVKIIDFGMACYTENPMCRKQVSGKANYIHPRYLTKGSNINSYDLYSLAVTIMEIYFWKNSKSLKIKSFSTKIKKEYELNFKINLIKLKHKNINLYNLISQVDEDSDMTVNKFIEKLKLIDFDDD